MKIPVKHWFKQYLNYSKKDRNAIIILCILILLAIIVNIVLDYINFGSGYDYSEQKRMLEEWQNQKRNAEIESKKQFLFSFNPNTISGQKLDSLLLPRFVKQNLLNYRAAGGHFLTSVDVRKIYGMNDSIFNAIKDYIQIPQISKPLVINKQPAENTYSGFIDPNKAGRDDLIQFGFTEFQAGNLVKYRKKGGYFELPSDLLKIYGIDSSIYLKIKSHIQIDAIPELSKSKYESKPPVVEVELNSADTSGLMQLAGVGSVFALRILKYRDLLGGFNRKEQLLEVYNFTEETFRSIQNKITVDTTEVQKIRLNFATYAQLLRHPYLNEENVKSILDYRNQNGPFTSVQQIFDKGLVDSTTYYLMRPYLSCR